MNQIMGKETSRILMKKGYMKNYVITQERERNDKKLIIDIWALQTQMKWFKRRSKLEVTKWNPGVVFQDSSQMKDDTSLLLSKFLWQRQEGLTVLLRGKQGSNDNA